jgi:transcription elongation GreA/GreB family factor
MSFDRGKVVWMEGKGAGEIADVNIELEKLRVDLTGVGSISVGFGAASKVLEPLSEDHFLYRKVRQPEELSAFASKDPSGSLQSLLESVDRPLTAGDVKSAFTGLVAAGSWTSWWGRARKHPQVVTTGKGARQTYSWAATSGEASDEAMRLFESSDLPQKLEIFRREGKRGTAAVPAMAETLTELGRKAGASRPAEAFTIASTLETISGSVPDELQPKKLLADSSDAVGLIADLSDKALRRQALTLVQQTREDWIDIFAHLMERETEPRILSELASPLAESDADRLEEVFDGIVAHPRRRAAAFVWLAENLPSFPFLEGRNPLRLMQLILSAEHSKEFTPFKSRLTKLIETSKTLPHLIKRLDSDQAARAEEILERAPYEEYVRQPLINALHLKFPELMGEAPDLLYALPASIETRRQELQTLLNEEIPANRLAIEEARALGDLRENFEYKSARQRHEYLSARATALKHALQRVNVIHLDRVDLSEIRIGTVVTLTNESGQRQVTILGPWESDPEGGVISHESESARRLLEHTIGDQIEDDGTTWTVESIEAYRLA